jgi:hypothetical protein
MSYENYLIREMQDGDLYPGDTTCSDCNEIICSCNEIPKCEGHPAGEFDPMGQTVYCDGSCKPSQD